MCRVFYQILPSAEYRIPFWAVKLLLLSSTSIIDRLSQTKAQPPMCLTLSGI